MKNENWKKYGLEFLSTFFAVVLAFALSNWNDAKRDENSENKILIEILNGLEKDIVDIELNVLGHKDGITANNYFKKLFVGKEVSTDSVMHYYKYLTRDFISIQNSAGYETLKSKGLEVVKNDSLRLKIISLYEYDYNILQKLEEEYAEMQFQQNYFRETNEELAPNLKFDNDGNVIGIDLPLLLQEEKKKKLLTYLWKIKTNRNFILS